MRWSDSSCYLLSGPAGEAFLREPVGKLVPVLLADTDASGFTRLDCFDQSLRRTGRLLLEHGPGLELFLPDGQAIAQRTALRKKRAVDLADGLVSRALADMSPLRHLLPLGSGTIRRSTLVFQDDTPKIRCRVELQSFTGAKGSSASIVWLRGLRGYDRALEMLCDSIRTRGGSAFSMETLYALLFPGQTMYQAKPAVALIAGETAFDAATRIIARHIPTAVQNEPGIMADLDTEFLHDYRVALRRIRSALSLFKGVYQQADNAALKARFSALMARTGPLRDLDVQLLEKQSCYDTVPASLHSGLDMLFALRATQRAKALAKLARHLNSRRHAQEIAELSRVFSTALALEPGPKADMPVQDMASSLIWKRFNAARRLASSIGPDTKDLVLHDLRIHCKKLRYLLEFSTNLFPAASLKPAVKTLKVLQTHLGLMNDLSVQLGNLQSFMEDADALQDSDKLQVAQSLGALTAILHLRKLERGMKTAVVVSEFASTQTHDSFRELFRPRTHKP